MPPERPAPRVPLEQPVLRVSPERPALQVPPEQLVLRVPPERPALREQRVPPVQPECPVQPVRRARKDLRGFREFRDLSEKPEQPFLRVLSVRSDLPDLPEQLARRGLRAPRVCRGFRVRPEPLVPLERLVLLVPPERRGPPVLRGQLERLARPEQRVPQAPPVRPMGWQLMEESTIQRPRH